MRRFIVLIQVLLLQSILLTQASGTPAKSNLTNLQFWKDPEIVKKLQLSDYQIAAIDKCYLEYNSKSARSGENLDIQNALLKSLTDANNIDKSAVAKQSKNVADANNELLSLYQTLIASIKNTLTEEQKRKLDEIQILTRKTVFPPFLYMRPSAIKDPIAQIAPYPRYTSEARAARVEGVVLLQAIVNKKGTIKSAVVLRGLGYGLDERAIDTVKKKWKFIPGTINKQRTEVLVEIEIAFSLRQ
jgi:TonB family protein